MTRKVILHKAAEEEIHQAFAWYAERSEIAAHAFVQELSSMMRLAINSPETWPIGVGNTRRIVFPRFPFDLVFRVRNQTLQIVAVAHHRRRPSYWLNRS